MQNRYFNHKSRVLFILMMIACASIGVRALFKYDFHQSALLYIGVPFVIALVLVLLRSPSGNISWKREYLNRLIDAFIIMLGSSVVLFEGFVCVVMFMPIYLVVMLLVFGSDYLTRRAKSKKHGMLSVHIFPLLILLSAVEGVTPKLSFHRNEQVNVTRIVPISITDIKANLLQPMNLQTARPWFLYLFPMPYAIKAGTLSVGDKHELKFRYYRWFVTNVHEGNMLLELSSVEDNYIKTTFVKDTSYISNYLKLKGTEIVMDKIDDNHTRVTLSVQYERTLDPYWYFSPITRYGVTKTAEFLIAEVIAHEHE